MFFKSLFLFSLWKANRMRELMSPSRIHFGHKSIVLILLLTLSQGVGCSDAKFAVRPAAGKVLCAGQPVSGGTVTFIPIGDDTTQETGKVATAEVKPDGTFVLSTYGRFDGAIQGKHRVEYTAGEGGSSEKAETPSSGQSEQEDSATENESEEEEAYKKPKPKKPKSGAPACEQKREIIVEVTSSQNDFTIEL
jgi:hypothetical protein